MSYARSSWRRCGCNCNAVTTRCMRPQMQCGYNKTRQSGTKVMSTQTCRALQNFKHQILVSYFLERYGTPSRRCSQPPLALRSAVTLGRRVVDPGIPVEGHDERALWWKPIAAGPGADHFTGFCREEARRRFAEGAYLYLYCLEITGATTQHPAKATCATHTVLPLQKRNWRSFRPTNRAHLRSDSLPRWHSL